MADGLFDTPDSSCLILICVANHPPPAFDFRLPFDYRSGHPGNVEG
jgi:hypothetical protein